MTEDHPLAGKKSVDMDDLREYIIIACSPLEAPLAIAAFQDKLLEDHDPEKVRYCGRIETAHCLAGAGMGAAILPGMLCLKMPGLVSVPVSGAEELSFGVFCRGSGQNQALDQFIRMLENPS